MRYLTIKYNLRFLVLIPTILILLIVIYFVSNPNKQKTSSTIDYLKQAIAAENPQDKLITSKCISYLEDDSDNNYIYIEFHEKHGNGCPGDPNTSPLLSTFRINKNTNKIELFDSLNNKFNSYPKTNSESQTIPKTELSITPSDQRFISYGKFKFAVPSSWKLDEINSIDGAIITTQNKPYHVQLILKIVKNVPEILKGDYLLGNTQDNGKIYEEVGIGGASFTPYVVVYQNGDTYNFQWDIKSNQPDPSSGTDIWRPDANFTETDLINIVKSFTKS